MWYGKFRLDYLILSAVGADEPRCAQMHTRMLAAPLLRMPSLPHLNLDSPQGALSNGYRVWGLKVTLGYAKENIEVVTLRISPHRHETVQKSYKEEWPCGVVLQYHILIVWG